MKTAYCILLLSLALALMSVGAKSFTGHSHRHNRQEIASQDKKRTLTVGVLTLPTSKVDLPLMDGSPHYVSEMVDIFLRAGGVSPIAIPFNASDADLYHLLDSVNGVFFTGGSLDLSDPVTKKLHPYTITSQKILDYTMQKNDNGDYFPLFGVCQGIELLHILVANDTDALGWSEYENKNANT